METWELLSHDGNFRVTVSLVACKVVFIQVHVHDFGCSMVNVEALDDKLLLLSEVAEEIFRRNKHIFFPVCANINSQILDPEY